MRLSANEGKVFRHMHESRYPMKTHKESLVIWICVFIGCLDSCMAHAWHEMQIRNTTHSITQ